MYDKEGNLAGQWEGVSGRPGSQDPALQGEVGRGPIPEGDYIARQDRLQQRPTGLWEDFWQLWPRVSAWPGGQRAWGDWRVWLDPLPGTDTLGRSGFSIHGGAVPGSAGCIDWCTRATRNAGRHSWRACPAESSIELDEDALRAQVDRLVRGVVGAEPPVVVDIPAVPQATRARIDFSAVTCDTCQVFTGIRDTDLQGFSGKTVADERLEHVSAAIVGVAAGILTTEAITGLIVDRVATSVAAATLVRSAAGRSTAATRGGKGLTTPGKFFGNKTAKEASEALGKKFGPPRSRPGADTFFNPKTKRSFNVHTDPAHGPPHVDIRRRGPFPDRKYPLNPGGN